MNIIENDINKFSDISFGSKSLFSKYSGVYSYSNENLDVLFNNLDLRDKEVLSVIKDKVASNNFNFYNCDITKYLIDDKKYDVIITSNISDYYSNAFTLAGYEDNLKGMLKDDGIIVCSNLSQDHVGLVEELAFEDDFTITLMPEDMSWGRKMSLGYVYKRK